MRHTRLLALSPLLFLLTFAGSLGSCDDNKKESPTAPPAPLEGAGWRFTGPTELTEGCSYKMLGEVRGGRKPYTFLWKSASTLLTGERSGESVEVKVPFGTIADLEILMTVSDAAGQSAGPVAGTIPVRCTSNAASSLRAAGSSASWDSVRLSRDERSRGAWRFADGLGPSHL